jgi:hypothetical protein
MANWKVPTRSSPCPPGSAPFRVKGHGLRARMAVYDRIVPGGSKAVLEAIDDGAMRKYLSQPILAASWYDLFAHAALDLAAADLRKMPAWESVASASALQARNDAGGIYKLLLRFVSPHVLVQKLGSVQSQYFDHGKLTVDRLEGTHARMHCVGIANQLFWWWNGILDGYVHALFELSGAKNPVLHTSALTSDRPDEPMGIGAFTVDIRWDP